MRPQSIIRFEQFYLGSTAITVVMEVLNTLGLFGPVESEDLGPYVMPILLVISYGLVLVFWYLIAHRASNIAKWILVVLTVVGLLGTTMLLATYAQTYPAYTLASALVLLLQLVSIVYLFRRDAVEWLRSRGQVGVIDITTFN